MFLRLFVYLTIVLSVIALEEPRIVSDSYLDAYKTTHGLNEHQQLDTHYPVYKPEPDYGPPMDKFPPKDTYGPPDNVYGPPKDVYGPPKEAYGPPKETYGPPKEVYGPPKDVYGPPANQFEVSPQYGPPNNAPVYGPPAPSYGPPNYSFGTPVTEIIHGMPHAMLGLFDKFHYKLDLFTIGKIILKLVIFKKIVSIIAIICLLLFIPSLKKKKVEKPEDDDLDVMQMFKRSLADDKINSLTAFVTESIENYGKNLQRRNCKSLYCKSVNLINYIDDRLANDKLIAMYSKE